jgi:ferritin-like metal-binding protein YciE
MADLSAGDSKLVQYLNEAYGTEMRLETALQEHITMAVRPSYRKRLKEHLSETKRHAREVKQAIARLGGVTETISTPGPQRVSDVAQAVVGGAHKAVALARGPLHMLRGTGPEEKQLKNAKSEYASEAEEIATYTAVATLAEALGNGDVRRLARTIIREEERMRSFLEKEISRIAAAVARAEVPAAERRGRSPAKRGASGRGKRAPAKRSSGAGTKAAAASRSTSKAKASARKPAASKATARKTTARKTTARKTTARKTTARKTTASKTTASKTTARKTTARKPASARKAATSASRTRKPASSGAPRPALAGRR